MHVRYMNLRHRKISHTSSAHLAFVDNGSNTTTITNKNNNNNNEQCKKRLRTYERNANNILAKCAKRDKAKQWRDDHSYSGSREKKNQRNYCVENKCSQTACHLHLRFECVCVRAREMWNVKNEHITTNRPNQQPLFQIQHFACSYYLSIHPPIHSSMHQQSWITIANMIWMLQSKQETFTIIEGDEKQVRKHSCFFPVLFLHYNLNHSLESKTVKSDDAISIDKIANFLSTFDSILYIKWVNGPAFERPQKDVQECNDFSISILVYVHGKQNNMKKATQQQRDVRCVCSPY